ncbi:MAG TPA: CHAT domain-containing protein [Blastocatellia bacterium]|nr:CHAT domain-containing protein [Blastocatellia bacterium]
MSHQRIISAIIVFALGCVMPARAAQQATDEALLRDVVQRYFAAFARKEIDAVSALWSTRSPDYIATRRAIGGLFADARSIAVNNLTVLRVTFDADGARVRVAADLTVIDAESGKAIEPFHRMQRSMRFVKEAGEWRLWNDSPAERDLARALVATKNAAERVTLLKQEEKLITIRLPYEIKVVGNQYQETGDYATAMDAYQLALSLCEQLKDDLGVANSLNNIGYLYWNQGDYQQALALWHESLAMYEALSGPTAAAGRAQLMNNIASIYLEQGRHAEALELYEKALKFAESVKNENSKAAALTNMGGVMLRQQNYEQALAAYRKALAIVEPFGEKHSVVDLQGEIANVLMMQGHVDEALKQFQANLPLYQSLNIKDGVASTLKGIGNCYRLQNALAPALASYETSLAVAEEMKNKVAMTNALLDIAEVQIAAGRPTPALEAAGRAAQLARETESPDSLWRAEKYMADAYRAMQQTARARQALDEAVRAIETLRSRVAGGEREQQRFFEDKLAPYHDLIELLLRDKRTGEALGYAERAKARVLIDVLQGGRANINKAMTREERQRESQLAGSLALLNAQVARESANSKPNATRLADLRSRLQQARVEYEAFQIALYGLHPELKTQRGQSPGLSAEQASALLVDSHSALLEYVVTPAKTFLFVITRKAEGASDLRVYTLDIKEAELAARAEQFRRQLAGRDLEFRGPARQLYDLLLGPAQAQLAGKDALVIIPDGALWNLPFQALMTRDAYLIESQAVAYAPSLAALAEMRRKRERRVQSAAPTLLAIGNPAFGGRAAQATTLGGPLGALPETETQVKTLSQIYGPTHSRVYTGREASESRVKAEAANYRVLHLATHGILDDDSPMYSRLVLAQEEGGSKEDGLLEAWEIMKLDLPAEMVVLSACETARGRVGAGEGVIGLTWSVFVAGSPTTVVSQWKVDAASTNDLMVEFHRRALHGEGKAQALRQAMLKVLRGERWKHPFYWAGFVIVGDAQ